jgi:hypothetical protein
LDPPAPVAVTALQLEEGVLLMLTLTALAVDVSHVLLLLAALLLLQAYAPTYHTLIDPP